MSAGNIKDKGSNYGSNYSYQLSVLQLLDSIAGGGTTGGCCPQTNTLLTNIDNTGAKNSTLNSILQALQGGAGIFNNLVIDTGSPLCSTACPTYSEVRIWNGTSFTTNYYDANGSIVTPAGSLVYVNPQYVLNDILLQVTAAPRTPTMTRTTGSGTITSGKRSVSFRNAGTITATVLGANLLPGEIVNFDAGALKDTLGAIAYNANGTDLLIITIA
jgi:hypothetical protein